MIEYLQLGFGLAIGVGAVIASNKNVKAMITATVKPLEEILLNHSETLDVLRSDYASTNSNKAFYKDSGKIIDNGVGILHEKSNDKLELGQIHAATDYLNYFSEIYQEFCHSILIKGIDNIGSEQIMLFFSNKLVECKHKMEVLFSYQFALDFSSRHNSLCEKYIHNVCEISTDWINSHEDRFRNISKLFLQDYVNSFIRFYYSNEKD